MFALVQNKIVVAVNSIGFTNAVLSSNELVIEVEQVSIGDSYIDGMVIENNTQLAQQAQSEMITELNWCDLQLKYHATGDTKRAISTVELINAYAVDCRDYVQNVDGVLTIVGDKPERPE